MADNAADEIRYGRDHEHARVFISSKMDGSLDLERQRAAAAVNRLDTHRAWWWESDAPMGVLHSEMECIKFAGTSDGLILLIAGELSGIVYAEYGAAQSAAAETYIFIKDDEDIPESVREFVKRERDHAVTRNFQNTAELETHVYQSLKRTAVRALREVQLSRRRERGV